MTDYVAALHRECPGCGEDYQRLARHWTSGTCAPPQVDAATQELLTGLVIGNATASGNGQHNHVVLPTQHRPFAVWVHRELGWLSHGVRRVEPGDKRPQYRIRTHAHPALDRYREWYATDTKRVPDDVALTPRIARAWYACDGGLEWPREDSPPRITFSAAIDGRREDIARLLRTADYDPNVYDRRVRLSVHDSGRFIDWIGGPVPGIEYRWALNREVARRLREADVSVAMEQGEWYRQLLALVADAFATGHRTLTADRFDAAIAAPSAVAIADWLGGGSFDDAKKVAGVRVASRSAGTDTDTDAETDTATATNANATRSPGRPGYTEEQLLTALSAAIEIEGPSVTVERYNHLAKTEALADALEDESAPSAYTINRRLGWNAAKRRTGVDESQLQPGGGPAATHPEACRDALVTVRDTLDLEDGDRLSRTDYKTATADLDGEHPHVNTIAKTLGGGSWSDAVGTADLRPGRSGHSSSTSPRTETECIAAVARVADHVGHLPSTDEYRLLSESDDPSPQTVINHCGSWVAAKRAADKP